MHRVLLDKVPFVGSDVIETQRGPYKYRAYKGEEGDHEGGWPCRVVWEPLRVKGVTGKQTIVYLLKRKACSRIVRVRKKLEERYSVF